LYNNTVPLLLDSEIKTHFELASNSVRKRSPKILHKKGDYFNQVFNFILEDSYMRPHLHPGKEKIEKMYLIKGSFALVLFDEKGRITKSTILEEGKRESIEVPAFKWHTYIMLSDKVIIYETMEGIYEPTSWKNLANWAPEELSTNSALYFDKLKEQIKDY
jgi:cupin fold WbuC family metalloprotein